jgi:hypothetical protein
MTSEEQDLPLLPGRSTLQSLSMTVPENASGSSGQRDGKDGDKGSADGDAGVHGFGMWTGVAFTVNYIMGCGFLGIPSAFASSVRRATQL